MIGFRYVPSLDGVQDEFLKRDQGDETGGISG